MEDLRLIWEAFKDHPFLVPFVILSGTYVGHCVGCDLSRRIRKFRDRKIDKAIRDYEDGFSPWVHSGTGVQMLPPSSFEGIDRR